MSRLRELSLVLYDMSLYSYSLDVTSLIKTADSRSNIINVLGFSSEEADLFNAIDSQKAFNIARWFKEWLNNGPSYNHKYKVKDLIPEFRDALVISGDSEYISDPQTFRFLDYILEDDSLYQKAKKKPLKKALEDFYNVILRKEYPGKPVLKLDKDLIWYDVGTECEITSGFLHNCGSLGEFGEDGELRDEAPMTMMVLKNKNKKPLAVMTVGRALDKERNPHMVIINASESSNYKPSKPEILNAMWSFARTNGYEFARIFRGSSRTEEWSLVVQTPGLDEATITGAGFNIIDCYAIEDHWNKEDEDEDEMDNDQ